MGWSEGSEIANRVWKVIKPYVHHNDQAYAILSRKIIEIFEEYDADDWSYQLQEKDSLYETYLKLNEPEEYKELMELYEWE